VKSSELKRAKRRIRRQVLAARDALPPEDRAAMGGRITDRFLGLPEVEEATTAMLFWSFGSEVPTMRLIEQLHERGVAVALPRIEGADLVAVGFAPGDPTEPTSFGAREPAAGLSIARGRLDVVAVPGVAFDRAGRRIGYGGGYYDRLLRATGAVAVALAFDVQVLGEDLPAGGTDVDVDVILTESETIRPSRDLNSRSTSW
jgi:5-formyltetrahydrofolate cyclo-ligase